MLTKCYFCVFLLFCFIFKVKILKSPHIFNRLTGKKLDVMNFGSYNYLGFAESSGPCASAVHDVVQKYGVGVCASRQEMGKFSENV